MALWRHSHRSNVAKTTRRTRRPLVEGLESRWLLAVSINEFSVSAPVAITTGPDGNLWFTTSDGKIGEINPTTHAVSEFPLPNSLIATAITTGPDGNIWFTAQGLGSVSAIGEINPTTHAISQFPLALIVLPGFNVGNDEPDGITTGPDGNLWFAEFQGCAVGEINPTTHAILQFPNASPVGSPNEDIVAGPDGNLWFTNFGADAIGEINPTTHAVSQFPLVVSGGAPYGITVGPNGNLWFIDSFGEIGEINPTTHAMTEFPLPSAAFNPTEITTGSDGNIWFTNSLSSSIGEFNPTTHAVNLFPTPTANSSPSGITTGPDGNIWFTENKGNKIAEVVVTTVAAGATRTQLTAAPSPSGLGQEVIFTAVVTSQAGTAVPTGTVTFTVDGKAQPPMPLAVVGGVDEARFSTSTLSLGLHAVTAVFNGQGNFLGSSSNTVTQNVTDGPTVVAVERFGYHWLPTTLVIAFNQQLNASTAQNPVAYQIIDPNGHLVGIDAAVYDPATGTVTLSLARRLNLHLRYRLIIDGTGPQAILDAQGLPLDGAGTGRPGSNFVANVTVANWVRPTYVIPAARG